MLSETTEESIKTELCKVAKEYTRQQGIQTLIKGGRANKQLIKLDWLVRELEVEQRRIK